jgi:hypothetical protein
VGNRLCELRPAKQLLVLVNEILARQYRQVRGRTANLEQRNRRAGVKCRCRLDQAPECQARGVGVHVHHDRRQPDRLGQTLPAFDLLAPRRRDHDIDVFLGTCGGPDDTKVQADFIKRKRDVLIGLHFNLRFHFALGQNGWQNHFLADDCRCRHCQRNLLGARAGLLQQALGCIGHCIEVFDVAFADPPMLQRLHAAALQSEFARWRILREFDELDAGGADIQPDQRRRLTFE